VTQTYSPRSSGKKSSNEDRIQAQLNDAATRLPLHVLEEYLRTLQLDLQGLPSRIMWVEAAVKIEQANIPGLNIHSSLKPELEALQRELRELPVHIQRLQNAIAARQREFSDKKPNWFCESGFADLEDPSISIPLLRMRTPMEMLRDEYKGMKLSDIAVEVLNTEPAPLTTTELTRKIYCTNSNEEFDRARNSLATELRMGAKSSNPRWRKCGRYAYCGLHLHPEAAM